MESQQQRQQQQQSPFSMAISTIFLLLLLRIVWGDNWQFKHEFCRSCMKAMPEESLVELWFCFFPPPTPPPPTLWTFFVRKLTKPCAFSPVAERNRKLTLSVIIPSVCVCVIHIPTRFCWYVGLLWGRDSFLIYKVTFKVIQALQFARVHNLRRIRLALCINYFDKQKYIEKNAELFKQFCLFCFELGPMFVSMA